MNSLKVPYVAIIGNHDCLGNGEDIYEEIFGKENFSFIAGNTKFICLNTNALEYDYSHPIPDFNYINNELDNSSNQEKTIIAMHVRPFAEQFNNNSAELFEYYVKKFPGIQFCLNAHDHKIEVANLFNDGITYYGSSCMKNRNYLWFTITPKGYNYEVVQY